MTTKAPDVANLTERSMVVKWLTQQGVPSVLLFLIMVGGWYTATYQAPDWINRSDAAMERVADKLDKTITRVSTEYRDDQLRDREQFQQLQRTFDDFVRGRQPLVNRQPAPVVNAPL